MKTRHMHSRANDKRTLIRHLFSEKRTRQHIFATMLFSREKIDDQAFNFSSTIIGNQKEKKHQHFSPKLPLRGICKDSKQTNGKKLVTDMHS